MSWQIKIIWLTCAVLASLFWGIYGCKDESEKGSTEFLKKEFQNKTDHDKWIRPLGILFSEIIGSFVGWCFLYILIVRFNEYKSPFIAFSIVDVALAIGATVGITGYSHKMVGLQKKD